MNKSYIENINKNSNSINFKNTNNTTATLLRKNKKQKNHAINAISELFSNKNLRKIKYDLEISRDKDEQRKLKKNKGEESMRKVGVYFNEPRLRNVTFTEATEYQKERLENLLSELNKYRDIFVNNELIPFANCSKLMTNFQVKKFTGNTLDMDNNNKKSIKEIFFELSSKYKQIRTSSENILWKINHLEKRVNEEILRSKSVNNLYRAENENGIIPRLLRHKNLYINNNSNEKSMISTPFAYNNNLPKPPTSTIKKKRNKKINTSK